MPPTRLSKCLVSSGEIIKILDWKRKSAVMALDITESKIELAFSFSPSSRKFRTEDNFVHKLDPIQYMPKKHITNRYLSEKPLRMPRSVENARVADELEEIIYELDVGAFVVSWPTEPNRRTGKECGKVLHVLDVLAERQNPLVSKNMPFTLWNIHPNLTTHTSKNDWLLSPKEEHMRLEGDEDTNSENACEVLHNFIQWNYTPLKKESHTDKKRKELLDSFHRYDVSEDTMEQLLI